MGRIGGSEVMTKITYDLSNYMFTGDFQHVIPINDLKEHEGISTCWCKPKIEDYSVSGGMKLVIHNALDGRELVEPGAEIPDGGN